MVLSICGLSGMLFEFCVSAGFAGFVFPLAWSNQFCLRSAAWVWLGGVVFFLGLVVNSGGCFVYGIIYFCEVWVSVAGVLGFA